MTGTCAGRRQAAPLNLIDEATNYTMKIAIHDNEVPIQVGSIESLDNTIANAAAEALSKRKINVIYLAADNGNEISMAVGGNETVLGFNYAHHDPPYFASKGTSETDEPVMTCYTLLEHHTEFPRRCVISLSEGVAAVHEFFATGDLPKCISWIEV